MGLRRRTTNPFSLSCGNVSLTDETWGELLALYEIVEIFEIHSLFCGSEKIYEFTLLLIVEAALVGGMPSC